MLLCEEDTFDESCEDMWEPLKMKPSSTNNLNMTALPFYGMVVIVISVTF